METPKITILWIEDNPLRNSLACKYINEREKKKIFPTEMDNFLVPAVFFNNKELSNYFNYFQLKILQHPEEIREYINGCLEAEETKGSFALGEIDGVIPEMVVFDYKLFDGLAINKSGDSIASLNYSPKQKKIREYINPNFQLYKLLNKIDTLFLEKSENRNYTPDTFIKRSNYESDVNPEVRDKDLNQLQNDNLGLFAGIDILRMFRNHVCVGIPATSNFDTKDKLHVFSKFYEWVNDYDTATLFSRVDRGNKDWDNIIKDGIILLRERIKTLVQSNKIITMYSQLSEFSKEDVSTEGFFSLISVYGRRDLPLNALFIDEPEKTRKDKVQKFAQELLVIISSATNISVAEFEFAKTASNRLINAYKSDSVDKRVDLSLLLVKKTKNELNEFEKSRLDSLFVFFGIMKEQVEAFENGDTAVSIQKNISDYRMLKVRKNDTINRLIVLFTAIQLHELYQEFILKNVNSDLDNSVAKILKEPPGFDDLLLMLYPVAKNPLVLPMHQVFLPDKLKSDPEIWKKQLGRDIKPQLIQTGSEFPANLSMGEKIICKSFAAEIELDEKFYPSWLK